MVATAQGDRIEGLGDPGTPVGLVLTVQGSPAGTALPISGTVSTTLPAAVALSDTLANPTTPLVGASGLLWVGGQWVRSRAPQPVPSQFVAVSSAANTAATLTIPAGPAGLFTFITYLRLSRFATGALAAAAEYTYTSTNLNGWDFSTDNGMAASTLRQDFVGNGQPLLVGAVAATAVTLVAAAAGVAVLTRMRAAYYYA